MIFNLVWIYNLAHLLSQLELVLPSINEKQFYKKGEADFIKVYQQLLKDIYKALSLKAPEYSIYLAGHKPMFLS